jgi:hypothetical protein
MNNTQINKLTLKCTVTGELVTYRGWDYISKRIEKAGSLELLEKTFMSKKGKRAASAGTATEPVKVKQTKEQSVASFNKPKGESSPEAPAANYQARLVDGKYILSKNGEEYAQIVTKP